MDARKLKLSLVALGLAAFGAVEAQATDLTVLNHTWQVTHPYFRSNCWVAGFNGGGIKAKDWVFFGGIGSGNQFTWQFSDLLNPNCRHPIVHYTFALDGEAPPVGKALRERTTRIEFDTSVPVYTIEEGNLPAIIGVTPVDADQDGDDD